MYLHHKIEGSGEPIVFIHGAFVNSEIWQFQTRYFREFFKVVTIDLRGHGQSTGSQLTQYSVELFSEDVLRILDEARIQSFCICGLSLGSMIAQHMATNYPDRVRGIVLVGATASLRLYFPERLVTSLLFPKRVAMLLFGLLNTAQFMRLSFFLTWYILGRNWLGKPETRKVIKRSISFVDQRELKKIYAAVHDFRKQGLERVPTPILIINGEFDSPVVHRHSRYIQKITGMRTSVKNIDSAGHACNFDQPLAFNATLEAWLHSLPLSASSNAPSAVRQSK